MTLTHEFCERVHNHVTARVRFLSRVYAIGSLSFPTSILLLIMTSQGRGAHRFLERNTDNNSTLYYIPSIVVARMQPVSIFVNPAPLLCLLMSTLDSSRHVRIQTRRLLNWENLFRKNGKLICFLWNFILDFIGLRMEAENKV